MPDTSIRLSPPAGSVPGEGFKGFQNPELGAVVEVVEMPRPFVDTGLDAETFAKSGVTMKRRTDVKIGGRPAVLLALAQNANGTNINKWLLVFGNERQTFLVAAIFKPENAKELSPLLRACVLTAEFDKNAVRDQVAVLPFEIKPVDPWAYAKQSGGFLTITPNGEFPPADATKGMLLVAMAPLPPNLGDRRKLVEKRFLSIPVATDIKLETCEPVEIDGLEGFESIGTGAAKGTGAALCIFEVVLFERDGQNHASISGVIGADDRDKGLKDLQAMAQSFKRKPAAE
ncbi:MAG TPA: hypothetical protein VHD36_03610 [Pirellulales bacterium]|nr:hypothetical protein [Pirellulales bacterium]